MKMDWKEREEGGGQGGEEDCPLSSVSWGFNVIAYVLVLLKPHKHITTVTSKDSGPSTLIEG